MTREQAVGTIAAIVIRSVGQRESLSPRQAAEAAWYPGHPLVTVEAIEARIIQRRAEDAQLISGMDVEKQAARRAA